jgi:uncharacterized protein YbcC (UPF0753/DUF2309 family)
MSTALRALTDPDTGLDAAVERACGRIAPTWPLDQFIAVNPLWGFTERPLPEVATRIAALSGSRLLMPRAWYREQWHAGRMTERHLQAAIDESGADCTPGELVAVLGSAEPVAPRRELLADVVDARRDLRHGASWCDFVTHAISQFCAAHFDAGQARLKPAQDGTLYPSWKRAAARDLSPRLLMGLRGHGGRVRLLPEDPHRLIAAATEALGIPAAQREEYFTALLLRMNGWAAWCAYLRWQARLDGQDDDHIVHLLAVRLAWEWLLLDSDATGDLRARWRGAIGRWSTADRQAAEAQQHDWLLQRALEIAYQEPLCRSLAQTLRSDPGSPKVPAVQAAFCIDVRSEVFRRALEATGTDVQTLGFAGFFGLPIDYQPLAAPGARPQLPGLLAPRLRAADAGVADDLAARRVARLGVADAWKQLRSSAMSGFTFVESLGLFYAGRLLSNGLGRSRPVPHPGGAGLTPAEQAQCKPRLAGSEDGTALELSQRVDLAAGILHAMGLTSGHARLVLLAGHGSQTVNNPHASALDCGACCGQTGEVNARVAAALMNDREVRAALAARGIEIPETTHFLAGLHDTTTDEVELFDLDELPATHHADLEALRTRLVAAGRGARAERAEALGLGGLDSARLLSAMRARARDWAQVRPEWGLANNASFVVARRERTRHLDLAGRAFLHDYRWEQDTDGSVLELILTAPMVVTHWINLQYYVSTVDNRRYGSGNKVLHNVVGGRLGVFEGNGGDLRIGLPMQSLHDGRRWRHEPLRLSVFVEAPRSAIDAVLEKHEQVRNLVEGGWLHLFEIDAQDGVVRARRRGGWVEVTSAAAA